MANYTQPAQPVTHAQTKLAEAKNALADVAPDAQSIYYNVRALQGFVTAQKAAIVIRARMTGTLDQNPGNHLAGVLNMAREANGMGAQAGDIADATALLSVLESSEEFQQAEALIVPIEKSVASLSVQVQKERQEFADLSAKHKSAIEAAQERALAAVAEDPEVLAAKAALGI